MASMMEWLDAWLPTDVRGRHGYAIALEEIRQDGSMTLRMEIPGIDPEKDVDVRVDDGVLTVSGQRETSSVTPQRSEFAYGEFMRMVTLPRSVDPDTIRAEYHEGILEITMAVPALEETSRHIPIRHAVPPATQAPSEGPERAA